MKSKQQILSKNDRDYTRFNTIINDMYKLENAINRKCDEMETFRTNCLTPTRFDKLGIYPVPHTLLR